MPFRIFPSDNNIGLGAGVESKGILEADFAKIMKFRGRSPLDSFRVEGLTLSAVANQRKVTVATGPAIIDGLLVEIVTAAEETTEFPATDTSYVFLRYDLDGNGNATNPRLTHSTSSAPPARSVLLGFANTTATDCSLVLTSAASPDRVIGNYTGNNVSGRLIFLGFAPKRVMVIRDSATVPSLYFSPLIIGASYGADLHDASSVSMQTVDTKRPGLHALGFTVSLGGGGPNETGITYWYLAEA